MTSIIEEKARFRQIGNSLGVIVPANIRKVGGFKSGDVVTLRCPRRGVLTISSIENASKNKSQSWSELQQFVTANKTDSSIWPSNKTFKEVLVEARDKRFSL